MANILLVQPNNITARALQKWLRYYGGHVVDICESDTATHSLLKLHSYDLVIVEFQGPLHTSAELCRSIRQNGVHAPILVVSAKSATTGKVAVLDAGADDILTRPFGSDELSARIRALLRRPNFIVPRRINIGDVTVDTAVKCAFKSGKPIDLSAREYALLEVLARNANRVLSLDEILNKVWSSESDTCPNSVKVVVHRVRLKLGSAEGATVENVHGRGYVIRCEGADNLAHHGLSHQ